MQELILRAQQGDDQAWAELEREHWRRVHSYVRRYHIKDHHLAEDITQEAFLKVFLCLSTGFTPETFPALVRKIARDCAIDHLRKIGRARRALERRTRKAPRHTEGSRWSDPAFASEAKEQSELLHEEIKELPPLLSPVLKQFHFANKQISEIQLALGWPEGTVKNRLHRARLALKERCAAKGMWND
jgi:RNA polymerase sigma-70 factor (ECF subfamily)